jgi:hypothetical protein
MNAESLPDHPDLSESPAVRRWLRSAGYDSAPAAERTAVVDLLGGLCAFAGKDPDGLVASCLRTNQAGDRLISSKGRRLAEETIEGYVRGLGLEGHGAISAANRLRGFLIHNGIFMQGPASIG